MKLIFHSLIILLIFCKISCNYPNNNSEYKQIIIHPNETAHQVALQLRDAGIINDTKSFILWARLLGYDKKIKSGRYRLKVNSRAYDVLKILSQGGKKSSLITIPEGYTIKQIATLLENEGICRQNEFIEECRNKVLLESLNIKSSLAEGYLFPDSYDLLFNSEPKIVIEKMVNRFWQVWREISNANAINQKSLDTILIIASLVEKEAKLDNERGIIASVFYNRLKLKMPLQSCATVQYILPNHKEVLSIEDTKIDSPYNTYLYLGLPPTPICNPGKSSLIAALNPAKTKYLYFAVSHNGTHHFAETFSEHQRFLRNKK